MRTDVEKRRPGLQIGYHHFALFRGYLNGLSLEWLGDRYLETGRDVVQARRTLAWIRGELVAAAKRYQHEQITGASMARLLRIEPQRLRNDAADQVDVPTLEDFQAVYDPQCFFSERELIEEFERCYARHTPGVATQHAARNERLLHKLLATVTALEGWIASTPKATDPLSIWIEPVAAEPLQAAGLITIAQLLDHIHRHGKLWYRRIPHFGTVRAKRLMEWLSINRVMPARSRTLVPIGTEMQVKEIYSSRESSSSKSPCIAPLERQQLPSHLDGHDGINRSSTPQTQARNDPEAINLWATIKGENKHTRRAYLAEAERFVLWITHEKQRPLSSATPEDCAEYSAFLEALATPGCEWPWRLPRSAWIGDKVSRTNPYWRPFSGALTASSRRRSILILKGLSTFLVDVHHLVYDPWKQVATPKRKGPQLKVDNVLNAVQWAAVIEALESMPRGEAYLRMRLLLWLGYGTGLRLDELIRLTVAEVCRLPDGSWELDFIGKGDKQRQVPLGDVLLGYVCEYMEVRGHGADPRAWPRHLPLLTSLSTQQAQKVRDLPLAPRTLDQILKRHFDTAADLLDDLLDQAALRAASAHWLRHTFSTELIVKKGVPVSVVQELLGHGDPSMTSIYTHAGRQSRNAAIAMLEIGAVPAT